MADRGDATTGSRRLLGVARRFPTPFGWLVALMQNRVLPVPFSDHWILNRIAQEVVVSSKAQWARTVMYRECLHRLAELAPAGLSVLEISPGRNDVWADLGFKSVHRVTYPEFDLCAERSSDVFDLIIADQVFEHLLWPYRAGRNVHAMLRPGGYALITTPFLVRIHAEPFDCSRWTETGLKHLLAECGFSLEAIETGSWGNRRCVRANFRRWTRQTWWRSLHNEAEFPVVVWALARKLA